MMGFYRKSRAVGDVLLANHPNSESSNLLTECSDTSLMRSFCVFEAYSHGLICSASLTTADIHGVLFGNCFEV